MVLLHVVMLPIPHPFQLRANFCFLTISPFDCPFFFAFFCPVFVLFFSMFVSFLRWAQQAALQLAFYLRLWVWFWPLLLFSCLLHSCLGLLVLLPQHPCLLYLWVLL